MDDASEQAPRFDQAQYDMLMRCSAAKDMSEWNDWMKIPLLGRGPVLLEGAELTNQWLKGANFHDAHMKRASLYLARLQGAVFEEADLKGANLQKANLQDARFNNAYLRRARIESADIRGAKFILTEVDGVSLIGDCTFDSETDFTGVGLDSARVEPRLKTALKNNIRRIHWQGWLDKEREKGNRLVPWVVERFWKVTDFGSSTKRIIKTFFKLAIAFASLYWFVALPRLLCPQWRGIIEGLWQGEGWIGVVQTFFRAVYFSIVTMTTLGFGDMHAADGGFWASLFGNIFLSIQVLLGYVLLGALITRLGILFTSEAPAAEFSPDKTKEKNDD